MSFFTKAAAAGVLSLAAVSQISFAIAADLPVKAVKPVKDLPFFLVIDDRISYAWMPNGTDPGAYSLKNNGTGFNGNTAKQVYNFTHFDVWQYGTNFFTISGIKSDHNDPAAPCSGSTTNSIYNTSVIGSGTGSYCAGATEFYGLFRSTLGWNELFGTKQFTMGALHNISFIWGADIETENSFLAPAKRDFVAGLQFAFDLPYKGYINVSPMAYKEINHNAFDACTSLTPSPGSCIIDGNTNFHTTWAVEIGYYMDLGFLPENVQYFSISGRAGFYGPKGDSNAPLVGTGTGSSSTASKTEINSEPIRLTFDASKAFVGPKYSHFIDVWVAYRYWQNKFGLDHNAAPGVCTVSGISTNSCTEQTVYTGVTVKF